MAKIEINGKTIEAAPGTMIIEVADQHHFSIPRFCYHKKLSIAANCRMCLVDVEKAPKALPACATPVADGMKIWTHSPKALAAQRSVMEFLLINHPLDCPICDQGGECELQDLAMGYGKSISRFTEGKRVVKDKNLGPLIATDMTRCIHCTRCVRFGTEIAGVRELGACGRGEHMEIGTYIERTVDSEVSGNIIDICPVGALTSKPYRFTARAWELQQYPSIAPHDGVGSAISVHVRNNKVMRVVPRENETVNEVWISDRDRFSYEGLYSEERLLKPKIKKQGRFEEVSWDRALQFVHQHLSGLVKRHGAQSLGAIASPNATVEELYLFQKFCRELGTPNIDHRLRQTDFRYQDKAPLYPSLGVNIEDLEKQNLVLLVGSNIRKEQPILGLKLRKMVKAGGKLCCINPINFPFHTDITHHKIAEQGDLLYAMAAVVKAIIKLSGVPSSLELSLSKVEVTEQDKAMASLLISSEQKLLLLGDYALSHPKATLMIELAQVLANLTQIKVGFLNEGANSAGAWLTGSVPHRLPGGKESPTVGFNTKEMWEHPLSMFLFMGVEPELDSIEGQRVLKALRRAEFKVMLTAFESKIMQETADVLLPITPFTENSGTYVNIMGSWQSFKEIVKPLGEAKPAWKVLKVLSGLWNYKGFDFVNTDEIIEEVKALMPVSSPILPNSQENTVIPSKATLSSPIEKTQIPQRWVRIYTQSMYRIDSLLRRAKSLQQTMDAEKPCLKLNAKSAALAHVKAGEMAKVIVDQTQGYQEPILLLVVIDENVPTGAVEIAGGFYETLSLGSPYDLLKIEEV